MPRETLVNPLPIPYGIWWHCPVPPSPQIIWMAPNYIYGRLFSKYWERRVEWVWVYLYDAYEIILIIRNKAVAR